MEKLEGIHFYINIKNLNQVILDEEEKNGEVNHSIHALDTYFSNIETFGKKHFPNTFVVEKSQVQGYICMSLMKFVRLLRLWQKLFLMLEN